jgi:hypothetical protein
LEFGIVKDIVAFLVFILFCQAGLYFRGYKVYLNFDNLNLTVCSSWLFDKKFTDETQGN